MIPITTDPLGVLEADVRADLERVEAALHDAVSSAQPLVRAAGGHVLESGGKRFRPMLALVAGRLGDWPSRDKEVIGCAVAIELTHLATLYHDDVMDEADVRRSQPSANARFDNRVAILAGDWLFARSSAIAADLGPYPSRVLADTISAVCEGQIMESEHTGSPDQNVERYFETIKRKTATLLATSCHLGAWLANADASIVDAVTHYGEFLGMAFQVADDVLDIAGVEAESGKVPGTDLRDGVWTLPVLNTMSGQMPGGDDLKAMLAGRRIDEAIALLVGNGSIQAATAAAESFNSRALETLAAVPAGAARDALERLTGFVTQRQG